MGHPHLWKVKKEEPEVRAIPGPRMRGTWGTHFLWVGESGRGADR
jgi:hypothetical protein